MNRLEDARSLIMDAALNVLAPLGVTALDMPATPYGVWQAIEMVRSSHG